MTLEKAKHELEKFVQLKTTLRPSFVDVLLNAEEVKHGHWEFAFLLYGSVKVSKCSVCEHLDTDESNYCPNCGAKMDEVKL